jgi:hypothetical protein
MSGRSAAGEVLHRFPGSLLPGFGTPDWRAPPGRAVGLAVTLTDASDVFPLFQHPGREFIYMLSGKMVYGGTAGRRC